MPNDDQPMGPRSGRIASLDGLRAVSIALVIALHVVQRADTAGSFWFGWYALANGGFGVEIFFVISGFLITTLLVREWESRGRIGLGSFYLRRAFRILPPVYVYVGVVVALGLAGRLDWTAGDVWSSLFFFHNYSTSQGGWPLEHLWSLSVEEQFYLVWPAILVWSLRMRSRWPARMTAAVIPAAVLVVSPLLRVLLGRSGDPVLHGLGTHHLNFDFLMAGCLVALLEGGSRFETVYCALTRAWWLMPAVLAVSSVLSARYRNYFDLTVGYTVESIAMGVFLLWCTRNEATVVGRLLNLRPVAWVGVLSFSIYLWQTLFLHVGNERVFGVGDPVARLPVNLVGILVAACGSYYLVERPCLRARGWWMQRRRGVE